LEETRGRAVDFLETIAPNGLVPVVVSAGLEAQYPQLDILAGLEGSPFVAADEDPVDGVLNLIQQFPAVRQYVFVGSRVDPFIGVAAAAGLEVSHVILPESASFKWLILQVLAHATGLEASAVEARADFQQFALDVTELAGQL